MTQVDRLLAAEVNPAYARLVADACLAHDLPPEYAGVLLQMETGKKLPTRPYHGNNIYGHDRATDGTLACMTVIGADIEVTEANYQAYLACVAAGGRRNGVGPLQITHWSLQDAAGPRLWDPAVSIPFGIKHFAGLRRAYGDATAFLRWNGKQTYADRAMTLLSEWEQLLEDPMPVLVVQMGHVGRPPNPGSVGTAREQDNARKAADAVVRHVHGKGGWGVNVVIADPPDSAYRGDAFVALHCDGSLDPGSRGASFGYQGAEGTAFAVATWQAYVRFGWPATSLKRDNYTTNLALYYGVRKAINQGNDRAFIFEMATTTNPEDRALLEAADGSGYDRVGRAVAAALGITDMPVPPATTPATAGTEEDFMYLTSHELGRSALAVGPVLVELTDAKERNEAQRVIDLNRAAGREVELKLSATTFKAALGEA